MIDPVLEMSWNAFLRKLTWERNCLDNVLSVAVDPEPDAAMISHILENRTLRWTMLGSSIAYWLLYQIVYHAPPLKMRCPDVYLYNLYEIAILDAAAVEGFLEGRISERTLWAVNNIDGREDPRTWLDLTRSEFRRVEAALKCGAVERPIFPWLSDDCVGNGYHYLGIGDARRFIRFLCKAWQENWPVLRLNEDVKKNVADANMYDPHFRDFQLGGKLIACAKIIPLARPCVFRYFG
jgi:hypothetical protein